MKLSTSQPGHWYKCGKCESMIPLPDKAFGKIPHDEKLLVECKCGYPNFFIYSDGKGQTEKWEVDRYFDPLFKLFAHWEER
jgi:hypothetical protein